MKGRNTIIIQLTIHKWSGIKIDRRATKTVNMEYKAKSSGNFFKSLVSKKMIDVINKKASEIRQAHYKHSLPFLDNGARIVPVAAYFKYLAVVNELKREFNDLADVFVDKYDEMLEDSKERLGNLFNPRDYPSKDMVRKKFAIDLIKLPFPESNDLRVELEEEEILSIKEEFEEQMENTIGMAERSIWDRLEEDINAFKSAMESGRIFKNTTIYKLIPLCEIIPTLNFTGMDGVDEVCDDIKKDIIGTSPEAIRNDDDLREKMLKNAKAISDKITRKRYGL